MIKKIKFQVNIFVNIGGVAFWSTWMPTAVYLVVASFTLCKSFDDYA